MKIHQAVLIVGAFLILPNLVCAQNDAGIFRSEDGGSSWKASTEGFPAEAMVKEFLTHKNKIFASTSDHGLYLSENDGLYWSKIGKGLPGNVNALAERGDILFAAPWRKGIYVSIDGGLNWQERNFGLADKEVWALFTIGNSVLAGTSTGIYYTWNDGQTWMQIHLAAQVNDFVQFGNKIYAAAASGILQSSDYGKHWTKVLENKGVYELTSNEYGVFGLSYRQGILKSTDGDTLWEECNNGLSELDQHTFAIIHIDHRLIASQLDGLYISTTRGLHWTRMESDFSLESIILKLFKTKRGTLLTVITNRNNAKC